MVSASLSAKIWSMAILGIVSFILGILPIKLSKIFGWKKEEENVGDVPVKSYSTKSQLFITAIACFGAGVILTTAITHMLPEVNHMLAGNIREKSIAEPKLPLAEVLVLCGFFMVYVVEELAHTFAIWAHGRFRENKGGEGSSAEIAAASHGGGDSGHKDIVIEVIGNQGSFQSALRGFLVILALSLHAVFEGIAVGLSVRTILTVIYIAVFSVISPLGIAIGIGLVGTASDEYQGPAVTVLQGLATGTLIYVVFFEVLEKERAKGTNGIWQVSFCVLGFLVMIGLQLLDDHDHSHGHGEHHEHGHEDHHEHGHDDHDEHDHDDHDMEDHHDEFHNMCTLTQALIQQLVARVGPVNITCDTNGIFEIE